MTILAIMFPLVVTSKFILSEKAGSLPLIIFLLYLFMEREQESRAKASLFCWLILLTMSHVRNGCPEKTSHQAVITIALYREVGSLTIYLLSKYVSVYFVPGNFRSRVHSAEAHRCVPSPHRASSLAGKTELLRETNYLGVIKQTITNGSVFYGDKEMGGIEGK